MERHRKDRGPGAGLEGAGRDSWVCGQPESGRGQRQQVEKCRGIWMPSMWLEKHRWDLSRSGVLLGCPGNGTPGPQKSADRSIKSTHVKLL